MSILPYSTTGESDGLHLTPNAHNLVAFTAEDFQAFARTHGRKLTQSVLGGPVADASSPLTTEHAVTLFPMFDPFTPPDNTFVHRIQYWAEHNPDQLAFIFLNDGESDESTLTYRELDEQSRAIAADLGDRNMEGERALLLFPPGIEFITAFYGCLYAGVTPVPAYPPRRNRNMTRIEAISADCAARVALTTKTVVERVEPLLDEAPKLRDIDWIASDQIPHSLASRWKMPDISGDTLGVLQYTSGSTGQPKGVMLTQRNLLANCAMICFGFDPGSQGVGMTWLPTYHDMGLVGGVLNPVFIGRPNVMMSPMAFLQKPIRWLRAISNYGCCISGGPNFAYQLCNDKITTEQCEGLDLSTWDLAFNGAEPVRAETLNEFSEKFAPYGFQSNAHYPCYGMAETTLIVTGGVKQEEPIVRYFDGRALDKHYVETANPEDPHARSLVGCGTVLPEGEVIIVNPETFEATPEGLVGEIWVRCPSTGKGYWQKPEATAATFHAKLKGDKENKDYLRTGDLGFLDKRELFVTGRVKDLIIIRGVNRYPQDIEATVENVSERLRSSGAAAFALDVEGRERLMVVCEIERSRNKEWADVILAVRRSIASEHDLPPDAVILVRAGSIPKTSSGKIQRYAVKKMFLEDELSVVAKWISWDASEEEGTKTSDASEGKPVSSNELDTSEFEANEPKANIVAVVMEQVRLVGQERAKTLEIDTNIVLDLGLDSLERLQVANALEQKFGGRFPDDVLQEIETIREVALAIEKHIGDSVPLANEDSDSAVAPVAHANGASNGHAKQDFSEYCDFARMPEYVRFTQMRDLLESVAKNPYFAMHDGVVDDTTVMDGREMINFSSYNYLGLSGDPDVSAASKEAIEKYGASLSSPRMFGGQRDYHDDLEATLCRFLGVPAAIVLSSGHGTNETTIGHLFGEGDLVIHDALAHNSLIKGAELSGARRRPFPHNDWRALDEALTEVRKDFRRVGVIIESVYSMDGDYCDLPRFIEIKKKHKAMLMIDEAHSIGTMGETGHGMTEHCDIDVADVDIWMGTLSKALGAVGAYIAGSKELVEYLRYSVPGFVYENALAPAHVFAAMAAIKVLEEQPERVVQMKKNSKLFLDLAKEAGLNVGTSDGTPVVPIIIGNSLHALQLSNQMGERGINVHPILHPAVEEEKTRLRYFITAKHSEEQIRHTVQVTAEELAKIDPKYLQSEKV